jgi:hypothetical protein
MKKVKILAGINQAVKGENELNDEQSFNHTDVGERRRNRKASAFLALLGFLLSFIPMGANAAGAIFSRPVPNDHSYLTCVIGNFEEPSRIHNWRVHLRSGSTAIETVNIAIAATTINTSESGGVKATVVDETGLKSMTVNYPGTQTDAIGTLSLQLQGGKIYELAIERVLPASGEGAHHYKLGSPDPRVELGWADPLRYLEHEGQDWAVNADANESVSITVFTDPGSPFAPQASQITVSVKRPDGSVVVAPTTFHPNGIITIPNYPGGTLIVHIDQTDGHFRMRKESGSDAGFYAMTCPSPGEAPIANCKDVTVFTGPNGQSCAVAASIDNGSFDPEGEPVLLNQDPPGPYPVGQTLVTLTVTSHHGKSATCSATVTVIDNTPPKILCPENIVRSTDLGQCSATVKYPPPIAGDNCSGVFVFNDPPSGSVFPKGTTTVTATVIDASGNKASCTFTVTVTDVEAPFAECIPTTNPDGKKVPTAGENPKSGQNPDGFYQLGGGDNCDSPAAIGIFIKDSASDFVAGPFKHGDKVKITQAPGVTPNQKKMAGVIVAHIQLKGDALVYGVDSSGNSSVPHACLVPPKPK